jgi:hypothetical protein
MKYTVSKDSKFEGTPEPLTLEEAKFLKEKMESWGLGTWVVVPLNFGSLKLEADNADNLLG